MNTWVVVAHRTGARIFSRVGYAKPLERVAELAHPDGHKRDRDIDADRPGRSSDGGRGRSRHGLSREEGAQERMAAEFARKIARRLETGRKQKRYEALLLVAEPGFLGVLRGSLSAATASLVEAAVTKDLAHVDDRDLENYLP